jgi:hypothetical protein
MADSFQISADDWAQAADALSAKRDIAVQARFPFVSLFGTTSLLRADSTAIHLLLQEPKPQGSHTTQVVLYLPEDSDAACRYERRVDEYGKTILSLYCDIGKERFGELHATDSIDFLVGEGFYIRPQ